MGSIRWSGGLPALPGAGRVYRARSPALPTQVGRAVRQAPYRHGTGQAHGSTSPFESLRAADSTSLTPRQPLPSTLLSLPERSRRERLSRGRALPQKIHLTLSCAFL